MSKLMELAEAYAADVGTYSEGIAKEVLKAEIEKVERDAARYRFWRDRYPLTFAPTDMTPEDIDRATDAAMEATNGQGN